MTASLRDQLGMWRESVFKDAFQARSNALVPGLKDSVS